METQTPKRWKEIPGAGYVLRLRKEDFKTIGNALNWFEKNNAAEHLDAIRKVYENRCEDSESDDYVILPAANGKIAQNYDNAIRTYLTEQYNAKLHEQ